MLLHEELLLRYSVTMHHAYLFFGSLSHMPALAETARGLFGFEKSNDPDVHIEQFEKFGIDEARELQSTAALKNVSGKALFVVGASSITSEAQQALLKLFEEPQAGSFFVLLAPHGSVIPTLRSRLMAFPAEVKGGASVTDAKTFLLSPQKARSDMITKMLKDDEAVRERVRDFLRGLEEELHKGLKKTKGDKAFLEGLQDIAKVRSYVGDRAPALKMLLEHLAVALPILR